MSVLPHSRLTPDRTSMRAVRRPFGHGSRPVRPGRRPGTEVPPWVGLLSPRETEVLRCVARGLSNAEIAAELHISLPTVKTHVARLLAKVRARDRVQLVVEAYRSGFVRVGVAP